MSYSPLEKMHNFMSFLSATCVICEWFLCQNVCCFLYHSLPFDFACSIHSTVLYIVHEQYFFIFERKDQNLTIHVSHLINGVISDMDWNTYFDFWSISGFQKNRFLYRGIVSYQISGNIGNHSMIKVLTPTVFILRFQNL